VRDVTKFSSALVAALRRLLVCAAIASVAVPAVAAPAPTQLVAVVVNGDPITNFDIEQRTKLVQLGGQKATRAEVIEDLINEKLKIQVLKRFNIPDIDKDVDAAFRNMARRAHQTPKEFSNQLDHAGVKMDTLRSRIRAEITWSQIIRGRFQSSFQFSDKDIEVRLGARKPEDANVAGYDYTLRPILFVVPRGSPPAAFEARKKEADELRARFLSCEQGIPLARAIRYVAVRQTVVKASADLPPALRDVLAKTELGHLAPPDVTREGVEIYALCGKKQSENTPAKKEIRDQLISEAFENQSKKYLKELRSEAMIEYR
jgi:peptidyl-prolyl cis-trans isomerase SurA